MNRIALNEQKSKQKKVFDSVTYTCKICDFRTPFYLEMKRHLLDRHYEVVPFSYTTIIKHGVHR